MKKTNTTLFLIGIVTGFVNGLFGSGGGIVIVPVLVFLMGLDDYKAHATAISIILPLSIISTAIYLFNHAIMLDKLTPVVIGGSIGAFIGAKFLNKIPVHILRKIFAGVIIYSSVRMISS